GVGSNNMAYSKPDNHVAVSTHLINLMISVVFCFGSVVSSQAQDAQRTGSDETWSATTETSVSNANPSRTTESHVKSGNRSVDKQRVEVLGLNGRYQPDSETEKETGRVEAATTRTGVSTDKRE